MTSSSQFNWPTGSPSPAPYSQPIPTPTTTRSARTSQGVDAKNVLMPVVWMFVANAGMLFGAVLICGIFTAPIGITMFVQCAKLGWKAFRTMLGR